jgi:hypothetical protein
MRDAPGANPTSEEFRRTSPMLETAAAMRLRDQFTRLVRGRPDHVVRGLVSLRRWQELVRLCSGPWFSDLVRAPASGRWILERRLTMLGLAAITVAEVQNVPVGTAVRLDGAVRSLRSPGEHSLSHIRPIWKNSTSSTANVRLLIDEGQDFLLDAPSGRLRVVGEGGQLVRGEDLVDGDRVRVLGFVDRAVDPGHADRSRAPSLQPVIRSGDQLPLLLWKVQEKEEDEDPRTL